MQTFSEFLQASHLTEATLNFGKFKGTPITDESGNIVDRRIKEYLRWMGTKLKPTDTYMSIIDDQGRDLRGSDLIAYLEKLRALPSKISAPQQAVLNFGKFAGTPITDENGNLVGGRIKNYLRWMARELLPTDTRMSIIDTQGNDLRGNDLINYLEKIGIQRNFKGKFLTVKLQDGRSGVGVTMEDGTISVLHRDGKVERIPSKAMATSYELNW